MFGLVDFAISYMQMERERRNGNHNYHNCPVYGNGGNRETESLQFSSPPSALSSGCAVGYIEHTVSKLDTLAGIAIKYGVEVCLFDCSTNISLLDSFSIFGLLAVITTIQWNSKSQVINSSPLTFS